MNLARWRRTGRLVVVCVFGGSSRGAGVRCPTRQHPPKIPYGDGHSPPCAFAGHAREQWPLLWGARLSLASLLRRLVRWKLPFRACGLLTTPGQMSASWAFKVQKQATFGVSARSEVTLHSGQLRAYELLQLKQADGTFLLPSGSCGGEDAQILTPISAPLGCSSGTSCVKT